MNKPEMRKKMNVLEETKMILKKYKIQANKKLGQNFLINEDVIDGIIDSAELENNDLVIEIGPGLGVLTNRLLQQAYKVIAIELDSKMVEIISEEFKFFDNIEIINNDILKINLNELIKNEKEKAAAAGIKIGKVKIVANLPYYISTSIIMKLLKERANIDNIIVMVQKEVADRIIAVPGTELSGAITYAINYYSIASEVLKVEKESFIPSPKVESKVIKLNIRKKTAIDVKDEDLFFDLIKKSFSQRRKTLANCLVNYSFAKNKEQAIEYLKKVGLDENVRGETLTLKQYNDLINVIDNQ